MKNYDICDLHGHFLPDMDDGSRFVKESLEMLRTAMEQGIGKMFATPHYYSMEPVDEFLARREESAWRLQQAMAADGRAFPKICLGAEVAYRQGIGSADGLPKLCLGNSRYLLLELPFVRWENSLFRDIGNMANVRGIIPVIAHIERYLPLQSRETLEKLLEQDVLIQMNASMLLSWNTRGKAKRLLKSGVVHLLGSDCHNMATRKPNMGPALECLEKCRMENVIHSVASLSMEIFDQAVQANK